MNELNDMTCAELADVAAELALGVLTGRERAVAIAHLDTCDPCREDVRQMMGTAERLRALLPQAEPPAGFETRVLQRLGLPAPAGQHGQDGRSGRSGQDGQDGRDSRDSRDSRDRQQRLDEEGDQGGRDARPVRAPGPKDGPRHRRVGADTARPGARQAGAPPAGPGAARRPGRMRRALAAAAVCLAVIAAGLGGWRVGVGSAPAASPLNRASLVSGTSQHVGQVFYYDRDPEWLYMSVDMGSGNEMVTCQVTDAHGRFTTIGSFRLTDGYGSWGSPDPGDLGELTAARLVSADGTVLATGTFTTT